MKLLRPLTAVACAASLAMVAACSTVPLGNDRYARAPAPPVYGQPAYNPAPNYAEYGVVRSIQVVPTASHTRGGGAILGAVLGAVVGSQIGGGSGRTAAAVAGAVGGGFAGNEVEKRMQHDNEAFQVGVRFDDGSVRNLAFQRIGDLRVGDRVRWQDGQLEMLSGGRSTYITPP